ncbi:DUF2987 domain-containing protein [Parashewanella spongiae]|uniref:DUF2987 domain-containing protein n=1 Tax=Parashewanella spongiae TaxID=342950 RepID=A0A3A6UHY9_9GAMM|nr:DUF2987 domain-containing protein [Parashewanella spongiae]MCL1077250.1 DUF2987 domain-containing protein [Parashewanella spongiae]RJY18671.1 DUF2987 domain-containing protein [Parashewanella spongiae]
MFRKLLLVTLATISFSSLSETISLDYKGFYDRIKTVNKGKYKLIEMAFFVPTSQDCQIKSGSITTESKNYPLTYNSEQRLLLPFDEKLKSNRALINLSVSGNATLCSIQMKITEKLPSNTYDSAHLQQLESEMNELLYSLQGFPVKYFSDPISGLNFNFNGKNAEVVLDGKAISIEKGQFKITSAKIKNTDSLQFSQVPDSVTPWSK